MVPFPAGRRPWPVHPKLFTYMRYNAELTTKGLTASASATSLPRTCSRWTRWRTSPKLQAVGQRRREAAQLDTADYAGFL